MFVEANTIARGFTRPVIISRRHFDGSVESGCAAFIVLNKDGWVMTAAHVFNSFAAFQQQRALIERYRTQVAGIEGDSSLNAKRKAKKIERVKSDPKWITNHSFWWGRDGVGMPQVTVNGEIDLAVGRLEPWDPAWVPNYPTIKDPAKDMLPGRSLCRLGYPFSDVKTSWDERRQAFKLDKSATPFFPLEGIYTRNVAPGRTKDNRYEIKLLETSCPGLMGQSGGPVFDVQGTVWALQSRTHHFELGFSPEAKKGRKKTIEHQFLSVGWAVHPDVIVAFLRDNGIDFELSEY